MKYNKLNIIRKTGNGYSYYEDENKILKGEWGGFRENPCPVKGKKVYWIYYSKFSKSIPIDEDGNFYLKFHCSLYDGILELSDGLFLCEKNNRFGVIDNNGNYIIHTAFKNIIYKKKEWQDVELDLFLVDAETGRFLYNLNNNTESKEYDEITDYSNEYFLFKKGDKYGLIDNAGDVIIDAKYNLNKYSDGRMENRLRTELLNSYFSVYFREAKFYGKIPVDKYEECIMLRDFFSLFEFYITYKNGKYGLLNRRGEIISETQLDMVYLYDGARKPFIDISFFNSKINKNIHIVFIIAKENNKYKLFNMVNGESIISNCDEMNYVIGPKRLKHRGYDFICYKKNDKIGYVTYYGIILNQDKFDTFKLDYNYWIVSKNGKWGVLHLSGVEYLPCIYDEILAFKSGQFEVIENGEKKLVGTCYEPEDNYKPSYCSSREMMRDTWDAMTDGQYGDMPEGFDGDFDFLGY